MVMVMVIGSIVDNKDFKIFLTMTMWMGSVVSPAPLQYIVQSCHLNHAHFGVELGTGCSLCWPQKKSQQQWA